MKTAITKRIELDEADIREAIARWVNLDQEWRDPIVESKDIVISISQADPANLVVSAVAEAAYTDN